MRSLLSLLIVGAMTLLGGAAMAADENSFAIGGDVFTGGNQMSITAPIANDIFALGYRLNLDQTVGGDVHAGGFSISVPQAVTGNVYAMGNDINISGTVGADVTAAGSSVTLSGPQGVRGNARLAGANVSIETPIAGATIVVARDTYLNAPIGGDFSFSGETLTFGNNAKITGMVTIRSSAEIDVPASVASPNRVRFERFDPEDKMSKPIQEIKNRGWVAAAFMFVALLVLGFVWLALFPRRSAIAYQTAMTRPGTSIVTGIGTLAAFIGLIPLLAITLIGFLLVPFAIIFLILAGLIGYIAGSWYVAQRVLAMFGREEPTTTTRNLALVVGLIGAVILGFVPFLGWLLQLALVVFGLGGIALAAFGRWNIAQDTPAAA